MRDEMNALKNQNFTIVIGALSFVVAAAGAGIAAGVLPESLIQKSSLRSVFLAVVPGVLALFALVVIGRVNSCQIIEEYLERSAEDIRGRALGRGKKVNKRLLEFQLRVGQLTKDRFKERGAAIAWLSSYGTGAVIGTVFLGTLFVLLLAAVVAAWDNPDPVAIAILVVDGVLAANCILASVAWVSPRVSLPGMET